MVHTFAAPAKHIDALHARLALFRESPAYRQVFGFITALNEAVRGRPVSAAPAASPAVDGIVAVLRNLARVVDEIPPLPNAQRFGNRAFRTWVARLEEQAPALLRGLLPAEMHPAIVELVPYLAASFGDPTRIDYGTGHELTFVAWLFCLAKLGFLQPDDLANLVLRVFVAYLEVTRKLQSVYWLEPAGSKGVWGLDDYQFLPFYWGASQLCDGPDPHITPSSILSESILDRYADEYLYLGCVKFITKVAAVNDLLSARAPVLTVAAGHR